MKYFTLTFSHAKSLKLGVPLAISVNWLHFKCFRISCGKGIPELPYSSRMRDVGGFGNSAGRCPLASIRIWALSLYFKRDFTRAFDFPVIGTGCIAIPVC